MHWCRTLQHPNVASLIGISDALPSIKAAMVFNIGPTAELVMDYVVAHRHISKLKIVS